MERSPTTLFVRHLPQILDAQEKVDFLCHFGADRVRVMGANGGSMKHTAFAQFDDPLAAELAIQRLHQLEILGHKLVVEYGKVSDQPNFPTDKDKRTEIVKSDTEIVEKSHVRESSKSAQQTGDRVLLKHDITYPKNPTLRYFYPPPTVSTLTNIANALASHPRFYVQVLHLMNKMNLPAPFGNVTPTPPLARDSVAVRRNDTAMFESSSRPIEEVEMEYCSTEESELESDSESTKLKPTQQQPKRLKRARKRMKVLPPVYPEYQMQIKPVPVVTPQDVFEQAEAMKSSHIQFNISATELTTETVSLNVTTDANEGFGKIEPTKQTDTIADTQKPEVNYKIDPDQFIPKAKISAARLSESQIKEFSVFKGYKSGETTSRLYIKNLHKHTTDQDLVNLFGGYVDWSRELSFNMFDVRVMKEGRMKGQAFVTMPSDEIAAKVVADCNGYVQNGKPMVIQFARSAKAKDSAVKK